MGGEEIDGDRLFNNVYQIHYDSVSFSRLDPAFVPYNNGNSHNYENDVILDIWAKREWIDANYVGVLSWRLYEKTMITGAMIKEKKADVITFKCLGYEKYEHPFSRRGFKTVNQMVELADEHKLFDFKLRKHQVDNIVWCNYWIAKPEVFDDYCTRYLSKTIEFFKKQSLYNAKELHRGQMVFSMTFFLEGLFSIYLENNKKLKVKIYATR